MTNFNRRDFLKSMSAAAVTMPFAGAWAQDANALDRPNILFLFTDQQFAGAMS